MKFYIKYFSTVVVRSSVYIFYFCTARNGRTVYLFYFCYTCCETACYFILYVNNVKTNRNIYYNVYTCYREGDMLYGVYLLYILYLVCVCCSHGKVFL